MTIEQAATNLVLEAGALGFTVRPGFKVHTPKERAVTIFKRVYGTTARDRSRAIDDGYMILGKIPRENSLTEVPWQKATRFGWELSPLGIGGLLVSLGVEEVEPDFLAGMVEPAKFEAQRVKEREELYHGFEIKVEEEIESDPEVLALVNELEELNHRFEISAKRITKKLTGKRMQMKQDRLKLRGSYVKVVDEREL